MSPGYGFGYGFWRNPRNGGGGAPVLVPVIAYDADASQFIITANPGSSRQWYDAVYDYATNLMEGAAPDVLNWFIDYAQGSPTTFIAVGAGPFTVASTFNVVSGLQTAGVNSQYLQAMSDARAALV